MRGKPLTDREKQGNSTRSKTSCRVEHVFAWMVHIPIKTATHSDRKTARYSDTKTAGGADGLFHGANVDDVSILAFARITDRFP